MINSLITSSRLMTSANRSRWISSTSRCVTRSTRRWKSLLQETSLSTICLTRPRPRHALLLMLRTLRLRAIRLSLILLSIQIRPRTLARRPARPTVRKLTVRKSQRTRNRIKVQQTRPRTSRKRLTVPLPPRLQKPAARLTTRYPTVPRARPRPRLPPHWT